MPPDDLARLDAVARHLPFDVRDVDAANDAFARWRETGEGLREVDLWAYCYVQRYFLAQFVRERGAASDVDACITNTFERVRRKYDAIDPKRFASYVSVACKNALRNHRRDRKSETELPEQLPGRQPAAHAADLDALLIREVIAAALAALPRAVAEVGTMRLLHGMEYAEIAERLGAALPTVRTYASRAVARLRKDPRLRSLYYDDLLPPGALPDDSVRLGEDES